MNFSCLFEHTSPYVHFLPKRKVLDTGSVAGHIGRGPGAIRALWRVWQTLRLFFPAGVDKTIAPVSVRKALFCTYVLVKCSLLFLPRLSRAQSTDIYQVDNMHRAQRDNAAAHTSCVCDTPICAVLL